MIFRGPIHFGKVWQRTPAVFLLLFFLFGTTPAFGAPVILALGDSLTAGFGVGAHENYPSRLQTLLKEKGYVYRVVNAGVSGDTTAGGKNRINWLLKHKPEIVIIELGANDGLRGLPLDEMLLNLEAMILACQNKGADVLLAGMKALPNLGEQYATEFENTFSYLAKKHKTEYIPFFLEDVAAVKHLTQPDGIHPKAEGYAIITQTVWQYLEPMLKNRQASR